MPTNQHLSQQDKLARQLGFKDAATYLAWQSRQQQIARLPEQVMTPKPAPQPQQAHSAQSFLDTILSYLPLGGAMQKAGNAMDGKK